MIKKTASLIFVLFCLLHSIQAWAATVRITGKAPEYIGSQINFNRLHDFISEESITLGSIKFNSQGFFTLEVELAETSLCFADFDGYHGMIYLEPGKSYEIMLPPKRTLTEAQKRNPFVKPEPVWMGIVNPVKTELNFQIQQFEQKYSDYENKYFDQIFVNRTKALVDTVKQKLDKEFPGTQSLIFESHKLFRKANLDFALHQGKTADFTKTYFSDKKPCYNLAAYATLFNQVYTNYFSVLTNTAHSTEIQKKINIAALAQLDEYFQKQLHYNKELSHWILLKSMYDAYYSNQFSKASILKMLEQVKNLEWSSYEIKTAALLHAKLTYLTSGTNPPELQLKNLNGQTVKFTDFPNTYIYLHFTDIKNPICRQHLDFLKSIAARYKNKLTIINVISDRTNFKNENNWAGIFTTSEVNYKNIYKVKTFPNSFLINKDGKLLFSPAPNPIDGLDRQLGQLFKSDYIKEIQKSNVPKPK